MQMVAAKAVAFREAAQPEFRTYAKQVVGNASTMADELMARGARLITNGTSNHLLLIDCVSSWGRTGAEAEHLLDKIGLTLNKNMIADDPRPPRDPSGIRLGTPAVTTRGMKEEDVRIVAQIIDRALRGGESEIAELSKEVQELAIRFPVPGLAIA